MTIEEETPLDEAIDGVIEFVGDEDVQKGAGIIVLLLLVGCAIYGIYLFVMAYYVQIGWVAIFALIIWWWSLPKMSYCADCGNTLGKGGTGPCNCGCNRWTTSDPGVGRTVKNR